MTQKRKGESDDSPSLCHHSGGTLTGSDSCWAVSKTKESELGEEFLLATK